MPPRVGLCSIGRRSWRGAGASFLAILVLLLQLTTASEASAVEPWSDPDPAGPPARAQISPDIGFRGAAEYRANVAAVRPIDVNGTRDRNFSTIEHRLRLDAGIDWEDKVRLVTSIDVLDGVLWGDNGTLGKAPEPTDGANVTTRNTNFATTCYQLRDGEPSTLAASYHLGLCETDPVYVRRVYGDIVTPVGLLRIGRQPFTDGASLSVNDGDGRRNRFGFSRRGNSADRILFATKPLEAFKPVEARDTSETRGVFAIVAYDRLVTDLPQQFGDDLHGIVGALRWLEPKHSLGGNFEARAYYTYRWDRQYDTSINAVGGRVMSKLGDFTAGAEATAILGTTREISEAFRVISNDPPVDQVVRQFGARGVVRYDQPMYTLYFETDYASGDSDPTTRSPLTQFRFAEDSNVGLLMFKHILAYQSGRAAASGVQLLRDLGAPSYPTDAIASRGSFTNAFAIFPQVDVRPLKNLLLRGGVLMAWAPAKVVDPIASLQRKDGLRIEDDLVNFAGGAPNRYYGTELDLRVQYRMYEHFAADLEGAYLFTGDAFADINGDAVNSYMLQARGTFFF